MMKQTGDCDGAKLGMKATLRTGSFAALGLLISWAAVALGQNTITAVAGGGPTVAAANGTCCFGGDGGPATSAELSFPDGVFLDAAGDIFIADYSNNRVREVVASTGNIKTVAGNGTAGFSGDGGPATSAELSGPSGVFVDSAGDTFIADTGNSRIREVVASTGNIKSVAGNGAAGFSGDGGPATSAELSRPSGVFVDSAGNIFIAEIGIPLGDSLSLQAKLINTRIREVVASTGNVKTVAGNGTSAFRGDGGLATSAELSEPVGVFVDAAGNIFIADCRDNRVREVVASTGGIKTIAGNGTRGFSGDGGPAAGAELYEPDGVFMDAAGNIFIAETGDNRVREVVASTGNIQTVAGNGDGEFSGDGGLATSAALNDPESVFVDAAGNIFIADAGNNRVREVVAATGKIQTIAGNGAWE